MIKKIKKIKFYNKEGFQGEVKDIFISKKGVIISTGKGRFPEVDLKMKKGGLKV